MARMTGASGESIYRIEKWRGLNENPDGDTQLKPGEAAEMRNFKITRDGNLQKRPGMKTLHDTRIWSGQIRGMWHGYVNGAEYTVFAAGGDIYKYDFATNTATSIKKPGTAFTDGQTSFFGFSKKLYILSGHEYLEWDGTMPPSGGAIPVAGYRPLIVTAAIPTGGGTQLEQINKLNGLRRVRFSPNGTATAFTLPEKGLMSIDYARAVATGADVAMASNDLVSGIVNFTAAPATGTNTIEIGYTVSLNYRSQVETMRFAEIYNGSTDNRVFIYGDGSNKAFYSGLDTNGAERADYFPDMNVLNVGSANTPLTALVRHYTQLAAFKTDSAYSVDYGTITLANGATTAAYYIIPSNRTIGNIAYGQAQLVENSPRTLYNSAIYDWLNNASYASNLTVDERQAKIVSQRVNDSLRNMDLKTAYTFDDNERQEYYVIQNGTAVVNNYATDTWYVYTGFDVTQMIAIDGALYGGTSSGDIVHISRLYLNDNGQAIDCYWRSGSLDFGRAWQQKDAANIYVTMKPEVKANVQVTISTNRKEDYTIRNIAYGFMSFVGVNFAHWSFGVNTQPQTAKIKIKAKKFAYYNLIFESNSDWNNATILAAEIKIRYTGDIK